MKVSVTEAISQKFDILFICVEISNHFHPAEPAYYIQKYFLFIQLYVIAPTDIFWCDLVLQSTFPATKIIEFQPDSRLCLSLRLSLHKQTQCLGQLDPVVSAPSEDRSVIFLLILLLKCSFSKCSPRLLLLFRFFHQHLTDKIFCIFLSICQFRPSIGIKIYNQPADLLIPIQLLSLPRFHRIPVLQPFFPKRTSFFRLQLPIFLLFFIHHVNIIIHRT